MPTFPEKHVVAGRYHILQSYPDSYFYGFLHEAMDKRKDNSSVRLALLHNHLHSYKNQNFPKSFFLPLEAGQAGEVPFVVFPKEKKISFGDFISSIQGQPRKRDRFFLKLLDWIYNLHLQSFTMPYLNPDLIFVDESSPYVLGPFDFVMEKLDPSIDEIRRFFSPRYLGRSYNTNIKLGPMDDYYPFFVMFLEALQGSMVSWDSMSCHLRIQEDKIPIEYQWMMEYLSVKKMPEKEEDLYLKVRSFLEARLGWSLRIQGRPGHLKSTFLWDGQEKIFPAVYKIPYTTSRISLEFIEEIPDEQENDCCYHLCDIQTTPGAFFHRYESNRINWLAVEDTADSKIELEYEQKTKVEMILSIPKNCNPDVMLNKKIWEGFKSISLKESKIAFSSWISPQSSVYIQINPGNGFEIASWSVDGIPKFEMQNSISLDPSYRVRQVHCQIKSSGGSWTAGIVFLSFLLVSLIVGVSWLCYPYFLKKENEKIVPKPHKILSVDIPESKQQENLLPLEKNAQGFMEYKRKQDGMVMVEIPEGKSHLKMGNQPVKEYVHDTYWIDKYEVTYGQFLKFLNAEKIEVAVHEEKMYSIQYDGTLYIPGSNFDAAKPVTNVSLDLAKKYARWAGADLPTEAEWCKAASWHEEKQMQYDYPWGNKKPDSRSLSKYLNSIENGKKIGKADMAEEGKSPYGLFNMAGNAGEFCRVSSASNEYIVKGGSFYESINHCQVYFQQHIGPEKKYPQIGFRCVIRKKIE